MITDCHSRLVTANWALSECCLKCRRAWTSSVMEPCSLVEPSTLCNRTGWGDRKSTRLNSSHQIISYAVFCLKKKNISIPKHLARSNHTEHIPALTDTFCMAA